MEKANAPPMPEAPMGQPPSYEARMQQPGPGYAAQGKSYVIIFQG